MADTPLIANIDVDMLPSLSLSDSLAGGTSPSSVTGAILEGCTGRGDVYVLPAFETTCGGPSSADKAATMDKAGIQGLVDKGCIAQFR